ncbi:thiol reductase thioredoxin [Salmonella enterica]|nr:thiol reductase thioredoxin [Salmonella enterica]ECD3736110.1 thiol reductase thioredoxin [Salmonella enterica subsp. enterica serovar Stanley]EDA9521276.1 conjugal transfer protein TraF [Salmonella enterica subsp. enterica serovar Kentucky]EDW4554694.1 conjugal transfer protein TraF [Salmonella enterica subsp. enterica serovar Grumpensis]EGN7773447.1 conjugal transfer protein TraF [Salmonella enterica subsp. enterica serovar Muenster]EGP3097947.1 conjugal transfer protein TraF [Salmonella 
MILLRTLVFISLCFSTLTQAESVPPKSQAQTENTLITDMLFKNRKNFALLYFVQPGCVYCQHQLPVMEEFQKETNWYVKTIDIIQNPEVRSKFNINGTPVIVLIKKNGGANNWQAVSIGYSPLNTLREDVFKLVRLFNGLEPQRKYYVRTQRNESTPIR